MPIGWYGVLCAACFEALTPETCAVDIEGELHDSCPGQCAFEIGVYEMNIWALAARSTVSEPPVLGSWYKDDTIPDNS
jgi:hypothetical protein